MDVLGLVDVPQWLLVILGIFLALYIFYARKYSYWSRHGVQQVWPIIPPLGNITEFFFRPVHELEMERYQKYGKIYGMYEGILPMLMVHDPQLIRKILVKDFHLFSSRREMIFKDPIFCDNLFAIRGGVRWKWMRGIVSQTFSSGKMRKMSPLVNDCTESFIESLKEASEKNEPVDCKKLLGAFTMDVIARTAFGMKIDSHRNPDNPFVKYAREFFNMRFNLTLFLILFVPYVTKFVDVYVIKKDIRDFFCGIVRRMIKERNAERKRDRVDFFQLLLDASECGKTNRSEELGESATEKSAESIYDIDEQSEGVKQADPIAELKRELSENEVVAQCFLFFIAGYETTATALTHALYHLALHPDYQERVIQEIQRTKEEYGEINYDTVLKMPYLDAILSETLRITPPLIRLERMCDVDYPLGDTGIVIPKGTVIEIPIYAIQHDPEYYPNPEVFDPERFMPENKDDIIPYTYLPFGAGPRNCVALRFALMEAKICLANVLNEFKFSRCPQTKVPLKYRPMQQFLQPEGAILKVERR